MEINSLLFLCIIWNTIRWRLKTVLFSHFRWYKELAPFCCFIWHGTFVEKYSLKYGPKLSHFHILHNYRILFVKKCAKIFVFCVDGYHFLCIFFFEGGSLCTVFTVFLVIHTNSFLHKEELKGWLVYHVLTRRVPFNSVQISLWLLLVHMFIIVSFFVKVCQTSHWTNW